tara:strand:+ start:546 stop:893 length:348 start_codon:yes stop_codon:yes gene_type:complete
MTYKISYSLFPTAGKNEQEAVLIEEMGRERSYGFIGCPEGDYFRLLYHENVETLHSEMKKRNIKSVFLNPSENGSGEFINRLEKVINSGETIFPDKVVRDVLIFSGILEKDKENV